VKRQAKKHSRETKRDLELFEFYYAMQPRRSYAEAGKKFGISGEAVGKKAKAYDWDSRIEERLALEKRDAEDRYRKELQLANDSHLNLYKLMQSKGLGYLDKVKDAEAFDDGAQAAKTIDLGIRGQREIMGLGGPGGPALPAGTTNIQNNLIVAIGEMAKNGDREIILRALKRIRDELPEGAPGR
jgi:hypothetical protein